MKHLVHQRRRLVSVILLLIFFLSLYLWMEKALGALVGKKLTQLLNYEVTIGSVKGGITTNVALVDLKLFPRYLPSNLPRFEAERIDFNFRFWDIIFGRITLNSMLPLIITKGKLFAFRPIATRLSAQITADWVHGDFYLFDNTKLEFVGDIAISEGGLEVDGLSVWKVSPDNFSVPDDKRVNIKGKIDSSNFLVDIKLDHFKIGDVDLSTDIKIKNKIVKNYLEGEFVTSNSIIDFEPIKEIKARYSLSASVLKLITLQWAEGVELSGIVKLSNPVYLDLLLQISNISVADVAVLVGLRKEDKGKVSGKVDGKFSIKGIFPSPDIRGGMVSKDGNIGDVYYDQMKLNFKGKIPVIEIIDSWIRKEGRYTLLKGEVDLRKIGSSKMFKDLEIIFDEGSMVWGGWEITRDSDLELELSRDIRGDFRVNFKAFMSDELLNEGIEENEFSLSYKVTEDETLKMRLKETEEFLGIEHKLKF